MQGPHAPHMDDFDEARTEMFKQLERDNFPRFLKSDLCRKFVDLKKVELKEYQQRHHDQSGKFGLAPVPDEMNGTGV